MPLFPPSHSVARPDSRQELFRPTARYATGSETTGRQVTDAHVHETRRRPWLEQTAHPPFSTPHTPGADPWATSLGYSRSSDARSPPPLANDRYELAGGTEEMDRFTRHNNDYDDYFHLEKQRGMWSAQTGPPPQLFADGVAATPNSAKPWMVNSIMSLVGGVAGKLFQFCSVPFRGFQAGGGKAYTFGVNGEVAAKLGLQDDPYLDTPSGPIQRISPGSFPEDNYGVLSVESVDEERPRMAKRQRTGDGWVVVDQDGEAISRPSTPRLSERRVPSHTRSPSQIPRPVSRAAPSTPGSKRPSLIPISRRSTTDRRSLHGEFRAVAQSDASPRCYSRQGYGSPVMFENKSKTGKSKSPLPAESQRLINKMRREEFEDDARLRRMSSQMSDMLREAREALGSKIEVEDEYLDESVHDDAYSRQMRLYPR